MDVSDSKFVEIYRARNLPEAHTIRIMLEEAGVRVQIEGELLQGVVGELPMGWVTAPRILVEESQVTAAREIIQRVDLRESTEPDQDDQSEATRCLACGQVMDEGEPKCQSCGWSYESGEEASQQEEASQGAAPNNRSTSPNSAGMPRSRTRGLIIVLIFVLALSSVLVFRIVTSTDADFQQGVEALNRKDHDLAISCFSRVIRWDPKNSAAYYNRGLAFSEKGEYDVAIADYHQAIRLDPKRADAYFGRGHAYHGRAEYDMAIADFNEAIRLAPDLGFAYDNRGAAFQAKGELDKAITDYSRAIRLDPKDTYAHYSRGTAYQKKGEYDKAVADYSEANRLDPKYAYAYNCLAWVWATCPEARMRDGKRAVEYARKACELSDWKDEDFFDTLAAAYAEVGEFDEAAKWQQRSLNSPSFAKKDRDREMELEKARLRLKLYQERKPYREE